MDLYTGKYGNIQNETMLQIERPLSTYHCCRRKEDNNLLLNIVCTSPALKASSRAVDNTLVFPARGGWEPAVGCRWGIEDLAGILQHICASVVWDVKDPKFITP